MIFLIIYYYIEIKPLKVLEKFLCAQNVRIGSTAQLLLSGATWKKFTISNYHRIEHPSALQWRLNLVNFFDLIFCTVKLSF